MSGQDVRLTSVITLLVGMMAAGKTTYARSLEAATGALRLTPDEWMMPLFGEPDGGRRDTMEGRLLTLGLAASAGGLDVVVDFGLWSVEERAALHELGRRVGAPVRTVHLEVAPEESRRRSAMRMSAEPGMHFSMTAEVEALMIRHFAVPTAAELADDWVLPPPPDGHADWSSYGLWRWPTLTLPSPPSPASPATPTTSWGP